ncbi:hypothetical protein FRC11_005171, partial [Ceratobasidium sp. 423]
MDSPPFGIGLVERSSLPFFNDLYPPTSDSGPERPRKANPSGSNGQPTAHPGVEWLLL